MAGHIKTPYGFGIQIEVPYEQAVERTKAALKEQGFGVLTEIDVRKTLKEKLNADFRPYVILGACNPPLAHQGFQDEINIGLLLPCNVIVYQEGAGSVVVVMDPMVVLALAGNKALRPLGDEAAARLTAALDMIASQ